MLTVRIYSESGYSGRISYEGTFKQLSVICVH